MHMIMTVTCEPSFEVYASLATITTSLNRFKIVQDYPHKNLEFADSIYMHSDTLR